MVERASKPLNLKSHIDRIGEQRGAGEALVGHLPRRFLFGEQRRNPASAAVALRQGSSGAVALRLLNGNARGK